jgi:diaminopimelate epimerase
MDYRNADGSLAEMCGNGVRVFARYLIEQGLAEGPELAVATRAGTRQVRVELDGQLTVDMGAARVVGEGSVALGGRQLAGLAISVGNPHLACLTEEPVAAFDLTAPRLLAGGAGGMNVEVLRIVGGHEVEMRVHERGSGQTLSCGTGAVAVAVAASVAAGEWQASPVSASPGSANTVSPWAVHVPGGRLAVAPSATASLLTGPAEIVARGELSASWLAGFAPAGHRMT